LPSTQAFLPNGSPGALKRNSLRLNGDTELIRDTGVTLVRQDAILWLELPKNLLS
jgi:hypothetical protein